MAMTPTDLYRYLPTFIRIRDRLASGLSDDDPDEAVFEKLVSILASMFDETDAFIQTLVELNDPDRVDTQYFSHISYILGTMLPTGGSEKATRFIIKSLVDHYKTGGTHLSWHRAWAWQEIPDSKVTELWKTEQQEVANYAIMQDAGHTLKSARIDLGSCYTSCESTCESTCESDCEEKVEVGQFLSRSEARRRMRFIEYLRPIHVLLRQEAEEVLLTSGWPTSQDSIGHYPMPYNALPKVWHGSEVYADFRDEFFQTGDELRPEVQCVAACEVSCQSCCEVECECDPCQIFCQAGGCELFCTENCQAHCEFACEGGCQGACAQGCQAGACTAQCAGACLGSCQGSCAASCQGYCTDSSCTDSCTTSCAGACTAGSCQDGYCMASQQRCS